MPRKQAIVTFLISLAAFLVVSGGLVVLALPKLRHTTGLAVHAATSTPAVSEPAATPVPTEFALVPDAPTISRPDAPSRIVIPSIALDAHVVEVGIVIVDGTPVWDTATFAAGCHRGTALPGTRGNTVLAGHISSPISKKGDVFRHLPEVRIGDRVEVYAGERRVSYMVTEIKIVVPTAVEVMRPSEDARLTLITCYPDGEYSRRLVVVGTLVEGPA